MSVKSDSAQDIETPPRIIRRSREEVARLAEGRRQFSYTEWQRKTPPATPEELADWEEFLHQREAEREANIAREAGVVLKTESDG